MGTAREVSEMLNDVRESEGNRREWIVEVLKDIDGMHTGYLHKGELVRCKECKHWDTADGECYADRGIYFPNADDFCSYGERKDNCNECWYWSEVHKRCENKCGCQFKPYGEMKSDE